MAKYYQELSFGRVYRVVERRPGWVALLLVGSEFSLRRSVVKYGEQPAWSRDWELDMMVAVA